MRNANAVLAGALGVALGVGATVVISARGKDRGQARREAAEVTDRLEAVEGQLGHVEQKLDRLTAASAPRLPLPIAGRAPPAAGEAADPEKAREAAAAAAAHERLPSQTAAHEELGGVLSDAINRGEWNERDRQHWERLFPLLHPEDAKELLRQRAVQINQDKLKMVGEPPFL